MRIPWRTALMIAALALPGLAQDDGGAQMVPVGSRHQKKTDDGDQGSAQAPEQKAAPAKAQPKQQPAAAPKQEKKAEKAPKTVESAAPKAKIRVLKPQEVPAELGRLESKADIKAQVRIRTNSGRPIIFSGVIRNGKLIETIKHRHFVPAATIQDPKCGVRLWWAGDSEGFIFFRYSSIESIAITGKFTAKEKLELMKRLKAKRDGLEQAAAGASSQAKDLDKLSSAELKAYLLKKYPVDKGWDDDKKRELTKEQILENKVLNPDEANFLKYFPVLVQARFEELKHKSDKVNIEPGTADSGKPQHGGSSAAPQSGGGNG